LGTFTVAVGNEGATITVVVLVVQAVAVRTTTAVSDRTSLLTATPCHEGSSTAWLADCAAV
jgi:hypothetical protein